MTTLPVHPGADAVLDALDPEQREVAAHPSGPMCVLAGAGTGKTRAITHRIAYGVLSGVYQPQRVLAVTFTARAAGEMRTRLRDLGVGGVQARTFHAASLRQLHYFWPQAIGGAVARGDAAQGERRRRGRRPAAAAARQRRPCATSPPRSSGRRSRCSPPSRMPPPPRPSVASHPPGSTPRPWRASSRPTRRSRPSAGSSTSRTSCCSWSASCASTTRSPGPCAASTGTSSSTSTRTSTGSSRPCSSCGWGSGATCASSATRPRPSTRSPVPRPSTCSASAPATPRRAPSSWCATTARRPRSSGLANLVLRGPGGQRRSGSVELRAQRADGPAPELLVADNDPDEAATVATRIAALVEAGHPPSRGRGPLPHQRPERVLRVRAGRARHPLPRPRRRAVLLPQGGPRRHRAHARGGPLRRRRRCPCPTSPATCCSGPAGAARRPRAVVRPASGGSRCRRSRRSPTTCTPSTRRPACPPSCASSTSAPRPSTPPPSRASRWRRSTRPRAWSGTPSSSSGCSDGLLPITMADTPEAVEEERRLLYVGVTRARERLVLSYAVARAPGAQGHPSPVAVPRRHRRRAR